MTGSQKWLGHDDLCSIQWSDYCDCMPACVERLPAQYLGDPDGWTELRPFEQTLSDGDGDLG